MPSFTDQTKIIHGDLVMETKPKIDVEKDNQHGPIVRVEIDGQSVAVYLMDETAVVTTAQGQYGCEVHGNWRQFKTDLAALGEAT